MAIYKVKANQNIWDVAIHLYGSVEGLFDLLISNPKLNMSMDLTQNMELEYHDYFVLNKDIVSTMNSNDLVPGNGERHVYYKQTKEPLMAMAIIPAKQTSADFSISGEGTMIVDWGDNTDLETINLTHTEFRALHYFDNTVDKRVIKIYGTFAVLQLNLSNFIGDWMPIKPIIIDEFISHTNANTLKGLFLFDGTVKIDLRGMVISDLSPILHMMSLQELDLREVEFANSSVLESYLVGLVDEYGTRRNCTVYLDAMPTRRGLEAINTIINEPAWNESGRWEFIIRDKIYIQEQ